jgi:hypothetical protein
MVQEKKINWLKVVQALLGLYALIWLSLAISNLLRLAGSSEQPPFVFVLVGVFMFGNAALLLISGWLLGKRHTAAYLLALAVLLVNIVLTFSDQFGTLDLLTLLFDLLILALLLWKRTWFFRPAGRPAARPTAPEAQRDGIEHA